MIVPLRDISLLIELHRMLQSAGHQYNERR